ncbi:MULTISPECIES: monovalent cation/H+ antiporter subunit D family protein [Actinoalloteichus]|uniref:Formate hydrogenlyase subunit 3/multisubunit Na+/H+ antiporter, MnhD subunit n=1 Tax=Actinoalloteichus fjordicus TaxID=1612552 RepID=A0AAC9LDX4_9PSEU|nr:MULTISPECIES: monovalent cation/H+ antiporter subunit D family protein [Actinoalloteichus]APU15856.1 formate hydrogenlyase subunit 3/multisubunit Na+/H+ antiporter, MnhD subunit [Actinoalloteichus fjordicus]APU21918.1 formate hydrogenlyase subunit 3/multisubunit Na+/H+ antiporter, MnhD subunit [Actinoalloteichus sp. GBA129-24]
MNAALLPLVVMVPLISAALLAVVSGPRWLRRVLLLAPNLGALVAGALLIQATGDGSVYAHNIGLWQDGIAIPFVVDVFSALMVTTTALLTVTCSAFAVATGEDRARFFGPLVLVLSAGVYGALMTGDLFNLFVFIEVMLLPSYGLLAMAGALRSLRGGRIYVTVNLLTSTIFLAGVALVYGVAGTVHLGELIGAARESPLVASAMAVVLLALSIKAAVVPVHGWLARTYPATSPAVTALFSGLHTKVAIYAIYRLYALLFEGDATYLWIGLVAFTATMLIGVLGAVGENTTRSILVFHMISQIGYILLGVALFTPLGLMAGIFYLIHHMIVKASLFLSTGAIEDAYGTNRLDRLGGIARREPLLALVFMGAALSLAGLPPFSGFVAKLTLVSATIEDGQWIVAAVAVAVSLITLMSMLKIWGGPFWGAEPDSDGGSGREVQSSPSTGGVSAPARPTLRPKVRPAVLLPALVLTTATLCIGLGGQVLLDLSAQAASGLLDPAAYLEAVTNR